MLDNQDASRNTATATATEAAVAMTADLRTSARTRPASCLPMRMATSRTLATSMPNRVAVLAMKANWVVRVTTPNSELPKVLVMMIWVANVASTPTARPITFCPAPPRMSR